MNGSEKSLPSRPWATIVALVVVALMAVFQSAVILSVVGAERDAAHVIDISGAQRMRSQELAFYAMQIGSGRAPAGIGAKIDHDIAEIGAVKAEIARQPMFSAGPRDRRHSALDRVTNTYVAAIRALEREPSSAGALAAVERERPSMLAAFDAAVKARVAVVKAHNDGLMLALFAGLLLQVGCIAGVWLGIVAPAERVGRRLFSQVREAREQIESMFANNPDGVSIYDRDGRLVRMNASRASFTGHQPDDLVGRHVTELVDPKDVDKIETAFARVIAGETLCSDVELVRLDGRRVLISMTMFPRVVNQVVAGINVVSKDISKLRAAEALNSEQLKRLTDLYEIASAHNAMTGDLLNSAITLVTARLGYDYGSIAEIEGDMVTTVGTCGKPAGFIVGSSQKLATSFSRLALEASDAYQERDFLATPYATAAARAAGWYSVCGMKILVGGVVYGTIGFASLTKRNSDLSEADLGFMRLACALIGTFIERGRQLRRLDALAFFDSLTGLPNREQFEKRLTESIEHEASFALYYVDLDRFKLVNDRYGHGVGDLVLKVTAQRLRAGASLDDLVARLSGDEFAILQRGPVDQQASTRLADRIVRAFREPIELHGVEHDVGVSVGIALYPFHAADARTLVDAADKALYHAKRAGRGGYTHANVNRYPVSTTP